MENSRVLPLTRRFLRRQPREDRRERLGDLDRRVARLAARRLLGVGAAQGDGHGRKRHPSPKSSFVLQGHGVLLSAVTALSRRYATGCLVHRTAGPERILG